MIYANSNIIVMGSKGELNSSSKDFIEMRGTIEEMLPAGAFRIKLENGNSVLGHLSGRMRMYKIRLAVGDEVKIEMTPYDLTKGRITYRF